MACQDLLLLETTILVPLIVLLVINYSYTKTTR